MKHEKPLKEITQIFLGQHRVCVEGGYRGIRPPPPPAPAPRKRIRSSLKHSYIRKEDGAGTTCHFTITPFYLLLCVSLYICV